jgi:hypothetical protein
VVLQHSDGLVYPSSATYNTSFSCSAAMARTSSPACDTSKTYLLSRTLLLLFLL